MAAAFPMNRGRAWTLSPYPGERPTALRHRGLCATSYASGAGRGRCLPPLVTDKNGTRTTRPRLLDTRSCSVEGRRRRSTHRGSCVPRTCLPPVVDKRKSLSISNARSAYVSWVVVHRPWTLARGPSSLSDPQARIRRKALNDVHHFPPFMLLAPSAGERARRPVTGFGRHAEGC